MLGSFKDRLADMVRANVYDLLELAELLPDQTENELAGSEHYAQDQLGTQIARRHTLRAEIPTLEASLKTSRHEAEQAVDKGDDDLARLVLSKQLDVDRRLSEMQRELDGLDHSIGALEGLLAKLKAARQANE